MMFGLLIVVHVLIAVFLIGIILLQGGRGGLGEALGGAAAQSLFGGGANTVMTRITAVAAGVFMITCLVLAGLSTARGRSVMDRMPVMPETLPGIIGGAAGPEAEPMPATAVPPPAAPIAPPAEPAEP